MTTAIITEADPELARLIAALICDAGCAGAPDGAVPNWCLFGSRLPVDVIRDRDTLLAHIAAAYVRRPPVPPLLPTPADVDAGKCRWTDHGWERTEYRAARGVLPWRPGDDLPEDAIRRLRDDADNA